MSFVSMAKGSLYEVCRIDTRVQTAISLATAAYMRLAGEEQMDVTKVQTVISLATAAYMRLAG
jgi:lipocalin